MMMNIVFPPTAPSFPVLASGDPRFIGAEIMKIERVIKITNAIDFKNNQTSNQSTNRSINRQINQ